MTTIEITAASDKDGKVHLDIPVGAPHARVQVILRFEETAKRRAVTLEEHRFFLENVLGGSDDPTFEAPPDQTAADVQSL
jgi:hypothetical protein